MIPIFRNIRRQLAGDNKPLKYMRYAIGEIVLVVIGILIALQVNNWNEERIRRQEERFLLENLLENLQTNMEHLKESTVQLEEFNNSSEIIFDVLRRHSSYSDTLDYHFFYAALRGDQRIQLRNDAYEAYKNIGFDAIRSKTIQNKLILLFENSYGQLNEWRGYLRELAAFDHEYWTMNFIQFNEGFKPINYPNSTINESFISYYQGVQRTRNVLIRFAKASADETETTLSVIKDALNAY